MKMVNISHGVATQHMEILVGNFDLLSQGTCLDFASEHTPVIINKVHGRDKELEVKC